MEKFKVKGILTSVKKYYDKEETGKVSGLVLKVLDFSKDNMNPKIILATLWLNNETKWSVYIRHRNIYDDVGTPDDGGYCDTKTQYPIMITYHVNDKNYKDLDEVEFLNIQTEQSKFTGFTDKDVTDIVAKAKEEVTKEMEMKKLEEHTKHFTEKSKQEFTPAKDMKEDAKTFVPKQEWNNKIKPNYPDWDKIAEGKVRHGVAIAFIENGAKLTEDTKTEIKNWVKFIMGGC